MRGCGQFPAPYAGSSLILGRVFWGIALLFRFGFPHSLVFLVESVVRKERLSRFVFLRGHEVGYDFLGSRITGRVTYAGQKCRLHTTAQYTAAQEECVDFPKISVKMDYCGAY